MSKGNQLLSNVGEQFLFFFSFLYLFPATLDASRTPEIVFIPITGQYIYICFLFSNRPSESQIKKKKKKETTLLVMTRRSVHCKWRVGGDCYSNGIMASTLFPAEF